MDLVHLAKLEKYEKKIKKSIKQFCFDEIDISLPGIDGITLAEMFLKKNITAVVLMTADKSHATNTALKNHKVICKPFNTNELKEIVMQTSFIFD